MARPRKLRHSPGQLSLLSAVLYDNKFYPTLKAAMIQSFFDYYNYKKIGNINTATNSYSLAYQKRWWREMDIDNRYL